MNNNYNGASMSKANNVTSADYCPYRLPCGYCQLLNRDCPKTWTSISWTTTCKTEG